MKLKEKGRFYEIPIHGNKIIKIVYDGMISLVFNDSNNSCLDFHGSFEITRFNQINTISPRDKEAFLLFYDLFDVLIKEAKADRSGRLYLIFENGFEIIVEDGPFENWHFTSINNNNPQQNLCVHGGVGKTVF